MDRVTGSLIADFLKSYEIKSIDSGVDFEKFASYCVISHEHSETFEIDDIVVGESPGIDGIGIIVNGRLINSIEEVDDLKNINKYIEVKFVFIQSKTSESFEGSDIGTFGHAILDIFSKKPQLTHNQIVQQKIEIINHLYDSSSAAMTKGLPVCRIYYVTTGKWTNDKNLKSRFESIQQDLSNTKLFSDVGGIPLGAQEIQKLYMDTKMAITAEITFQHRVVMPQDIPGVDESYIGILPFGEFRKIVTDDSGNIKPIFYDNVRAFQGENDVNKDIKTTITTSKVDRFAILNNGITIVAKSLTIVGNKATLHDYQVVNGCQTSHVIYNNKETANLDKSLWVPVKIISTKEEDVVNDVIKATNNQTEVKPEQLAALSQFQKNLEMYYKTYTGDHELYYERRSKQYANQTGISKTRIITIPSQIKAFAAMFLMMPHKVSRYYGTIVKDIGSEIFSPEHQLIAYYTSAFAYYKLESFFRMGTIDAKYKKCRFHILCIFAGVVAGPNMPPLNSKKMEGYCKKLLEVLNDDAKCHQNFKKAIALIEKLKIDIANRDTFKTQAVTEKLKQAIAKDVKIQVGGGRSPRGHPGVL